MTRTKGNVEATVKKLVLSIGCAWLSFACSAKEDSQVGSNCDEGCELESEKVACTLLTTRVVVGVRPTLPDGGTASPPLNHLCFPNEVQPVSGGELSCEVVAVPISGDAAGFCASSPALSPTAPGAPIAGCVLAQVDGESSGPGWYFSQLDDECPTNSQAGMRFTDDALSPVDFDLHVSCFAAVVAAGDYVPAAAEPNESIAVDPQDCRYAAAAGAEGVGGACLPGYVPENGFDQRQVYIETDSAACPQGVCMVAGLVGDPRADCVPERVDGHLQHRCVEPGEADEYIYCTCDCGDLDGRPGCECPTGYSCEHVLEDNPALQSPPDGSSGRYCIKDSNLD